MRAAPKDARAHYWLGKLQLAAGEHRARCASSSWRGSSTTRISRLAPPWPRREEGRSRAPRERRAAIRPRRSGQFPSSRSDAHPPAAMMTWSTGRIPSSRQARHQPARQLDVVPGRGGVARGMVVREDDRGGPLAQRREERIPGLNRAGPAGPLRHLDVLEQPQANVEQQDAEGLHGPVGQPRSQVVAGGRRAPDRAFRGSLGLGHPPPQLQGRHRAPPPAPPLSRRPGARSRRRGPGAPGRRTASRALRPGAARRCRR